MFLCIICSIATQVRKQRKTETLYIKFAIKSGMKVLTTDRISSCKLVSPQVKADERFSFHFVCMNRYLVSLNIIKPMCDLLTVMDSKIVQVSLNGLENILRLGEQEAKQNETGINSYCALIEEAYGTAANTTSPWQQEEFLQTQKKSSLLNWVCRVKTICVLTRRLE